MESIYEGLPQTFNVAQHLIERNLRAGRAEKRAFVDDVAISYGDVAALAWAAAARFCALGVEPEQRVALLLPDGIDLVAAFLGAIWMGAVPVAINLAHSADDVRFIVADSRARLLLSRAANVAALGIEPTGPLRHVLRVDVAAEWALDRAASRPSVATTSKDEPAFWLYTSGSSGRPKAVVHAHHAVAVCAESYARRTIGMGEHDIVYSVARIPFAYGLGNSVTMPMWLGATAVLSNAANAFDYVRDIHRHRPTVLFGIPQTFAAILAVSELAPLDARSLRLCMSSAESLPESLWSEWQRRHGIGIVEGVGSTETLHQYLSNDPAAPRPGRSGRAVAGYDLRLVGADGNPVPDGEPGTLVVRGESLMLGYWNRLADTRRALAGGELHTGDRYVRDSDGTYRFVGRNDDLFKVNGQWVSPREVEEVIAEHTAVLECAVVAAPAADATTQVIAYLALRPDAGDEALGAVRAYARARLPHFKAPRQLHVLSALPRNATGKVDRKQLQQRVQRETT